MELIEISDLCKVYGQGANTVTALDHVSLTIEQGEFIAIIGPSGSGKSTLLHIIGGVDIPTSGHVYLNGQSREKLAIFRRRQVGLIYQFHNLIPTLNVVENITLPNLYEAPLMLEKAHFSQVVCRELGIDTPEPDLTEWLQLMEQIKTRRYVLTIGLVGKYVGLHDAYLSVVEALHHAGYSHQTLIQIRWIDSEELTVCNCAEKLSGLDGILVPGGFGDRGTEGMILAADHARKNKLPYLGICLGMQIAVIAYARNVAQLTDANSGEFDEQCPHKVIDFLAGQRVGGDKGGTLRLGAYPLSIQPGTTLARCYQRLQAQERHRHRYEFNNAYRQLLTDCGLILCGLSPDGTLVEAIELPDHPFYVGVQFHPEFKSRPNKPHPLFQGFIAAALSHSGQDDPIQKEV